MARRASAGRIQRGVVEIHVHDGHWADALAGMLPQLAARLAALFPELHVRKYRLRVEHRPVGPAAPVSPEVASDRTTDEGPPAIPLATGDTPEGGQSLSAGRLEALAERYLQRRLDR